ncbi:hypothetical protein [Methylobacterium sp. J-070]|uniref:hypothetical protein n=1 Tax=Methylobacterium sp. J-070 TaxID=2836650 RepID=UPI001FBB4A70|nr:hypothetical protein [Methylobacterium sp. J-070]MCJ2052342.1 hypothetical protein [Methylobacterium sp. J-070]
MSVFLQPPSADASGRLHRRAVALANVRWFRAMAWRALRTGGPKAELRAANARAAARIVIRQAQREAVIGRIARGALAEDRERGVPAISG